MGKKFRALKENIRAVFITPVCVLLIFLFTSACVTGSRIVNFNNESTSSIVTVSEKPVDQIATSSPQDTSSSQVASSSQAQLNKLPQFTTTTDESENSKISVDENEIVCRTRIVTGSLLKTRICLTKKAWAESDKKNSRKIDQYDRTLRYWNDKGYKFDPATAGHMPYTGTGESLKPPSPQ